MKGIVASLILATLAATVAAPALADDAGTFIQDLLDRRAVTLFGSKPLEASATPSVPSGYRRPNDVARDTVELAPDLSATFVSRSIAEGTASTVLFPTYAPTHLLTCVDSPRTVLGTSSKTGTKYNPSVQRINLMTGQVATVLRGLDRCGGIRATPWGTVIVGESADDGRVYELLRPLVTNEVALVNRATAKFSRANVVRRQALPIFAWRGFDVSKDGVVYGADRLIPGTTAADADGGAVFKFIPDLPWDGTPVTSLSNSPLAAGKTYALRVSCKPTTIQTGQGCESGNGSWVEVTAGRARLDAAANGATGFLQTSDLRFDPGYEDEGVRACMTTAGAEVAGNPGAVTCFTDTIPLLAPQPNPSGAVLMTVLSRPFMLGDAEFSTLDQLAFQPDSGNLIVTEARQNGDIFACLEDGPDRDALSDACQRWLSVKDSSAVPAGLVFEPLGTSVYLVVSRSDDSAMELYDGFRTDDLIRVGGLRN